MGGTYTRARAKARSRGKPRGSRGTRRHKTSTTARSDRPDLSTWTAYAGRPLAGGRVGTVRSLGRAFRSRSLGRPRRLRQRSSQRIGSSGQEPGRSPPFFEELSERQRTGDRRFGDDHDVDTSGKELGGQPKSLSDDPLGPVAANGIAEFACHRNSQPGCFVIRTGGQKHDAARQRDARSTLLNREELAALAEPPGLRK
jgi:hypothetical protein